MTFRRPLSVALAVFCLWAGAAMAESPPSDTADTRASGSAIADRVIAAAGGEKLREVAQLDFEFVVTNAGKEAFVASHRWNRRDQLDRVQWTDDQGRRLDAVVDIGHRNGDPDRAAAETEWASIDGEPAADETVDILKKAYQRWVNDAYWLMMPLKLKDPGADLERVENRTWRDATWQVVKLTFGDVGLTPGDTYWVYVDPASNRVGRWTMKLEGQSGEPTPVTWTDYQSVGPLTLAHDHRIEGTKRHIRFRRTRVHDSVQDSVFEAPTASSDPINSSQ
jgi:hypothetical protein